jgi:hypothetical protein
MPTPEARIGPMVEPHPISFLTTNSYMEAIHMKTVYIFPMSQVKRSRNKKLDVHLGTKTRCA